MTALTTTSTSLLASSDPLPLKAVERLFEHLLGQLGDKVHRLFGNAEPEVVKREWAIALSGFRGREIDRGLQVMRTREFVPTVGEFARLCRPALDAEYAWYEAQDGLRARDRGEVGEWSHPGVYRAAVAMGALGVNVRTGSFAPTRKRWEMVLSRELAAGWEEDVPLPVARIESAPALREIPPAVKRKLSQLNTLLYGKRPTS